MQTHGSLLRSSPLQTMVENRTVHSMKRVEINLFETHEEAHAVQLKFGAPVLASMLRGKKIMHLRSAAGFSFLPGESILLPENEMMKIDFPDATDERPTKCLAMAIDPELIDKVVEEMNDTRPRQGKRTWRNCDYNFHFTNEVAVNQLIHRLIYLCIEDHSCKDLFVDMLLGELLIRILESESRHHLLGHAEAQVNDDAIASVVTYIRQHLDDKIAVSDLSKRACMSESGFYRAFKNEIGQSPVEFMNEERVKLAAHLLVDEGQSIREIALRCGFSSVSYFNRIFKRFFNGLSPTDYRDRQGSGLNFR